MINVKLPVGEKMDRQSMAKLLLSVISVRITYLLSHFLLVLLSKACPCIFVGSGWSAGAKKHHSMFYVL